MQLFVNHDSDVLIKLVSYVFEFYVVNGFKLFCNAFEVRPHQFHPANDVLQFYDKNY